MMKGVASAEGTEAYATIRGATANTAPYELRERERDDDGEKFQWRFQEMTELIIDPKGICF